MTEAYDSPETSSDDDGLRLAVSGLIEDFKSLRQQGFDFLNSLVLAEEEPEAIPIASFRPEEAIGSGVSWERAFANRSISLFAQRSNFQKVRN